MEEKNKAADEALSSIKRKNLSKLAEGKPYAITAAEARRISEDPARLLKRIHKAIREAAQEGISFFCWEMYGVDSVCLGKAIVVLTGEGFKIKPLKQKGKDKRNVELEIEW